MAYQTGTVNGVYNLANAVVDFLIAQGWPVQNSERFTGLRKTWILDGSTISEGDNMFDRDSECTFFSYAYSYNPWCAWQYYAATALTAIRVKCPNSGSVGRMIGAFRIEYSDDGDFWVSTGDNHVANNWAFGEWREFPLTSSGAHTYWRLKATLNNGDSTYTQFGRLIPVTSGGAQTKLWPQFQATQQSPVADRGPKVVQKLVVYSDEDLGHSTIGVESGTGQLITARGVGPTQTEDVIDLLRPTPAYVWMPAPPLGTNIEYWLVCDSYRWCLVIDVEGRNYMLHNGYLNPYGSPNQYGAPIALGGSCELKTSGQNPQGEDDWGFTSPADKNLYISMPTGSWIEFTHGSSASRTQTANVVWPSRTETSPGLYQPWEGNIKGCWSSDPTQQHFVLPLTPNSRSPAYEVLGEFEGLFKIQGWELNSQDTFSISAENYMVFQNGFRDGIKEMWAMKLV